jgi:multidrug efflux system outer membrane protein
MRLDYKWFLRKFSGLSGKSTSALLVALVMLSMTLLSCTPIKRQEPQLLIPENFKNAQGNVTEGLSIENWWEEFKDEKLNALVVDALKQNHDIRTATERVLQARAMLGVSHALRFPTLNLNLSAMRQRQTTMGITSHTNTFNINLMASYEADLWGRFSSEEKKALAALGSMEETRRVILQTVVSDVVNLYLHAKALKEMIALRQHYISNTEDNLKAIKERYNLGRASYLEVLQAQGTLSEALSQVEPLKRQLRETLYRLSILTGRYPEELDVSNGPITAYVENLEPVPVGLPSELLLRRPDIRAQALKAEEAFQALKVARARRFPSITLTATGGWASSELKDLFKPESLFWQLSAGVLQPLFDAGRLKAQEEAARAGYRESLINYAKIVLQAFYEVEKGLSDRKSLYEQRTALSGLVSDLERAYRLALERYKLGLVDLTTVLQLQRQLYGARLNLLSTEEAILANRVFLYRALGGKWVDERWNTRG